MKTEIPYYILTPCEHSDELMLTTSCRRGAKLARILCRRCAQTHKGPWRYYFSPSGADRWLALMDAGYHPIRRGESWRYTRDPKPVGLSKALAEARK